jgi:hypothetical protein
MSGGTGRPGGRDGNGSPDSNGPPDGNPQRQDDEAHVAALLAVLALTRADTVAQTTGLQQWRARRLAALAEGRQRMLPVWPRLKRPG